MYAYEKKKRRENKRMMTDPDVHHDWIHWFPFSMGKCVNWSSTFMCDGYK